MKKSSCYWNPKAKNAEEKDDSGASLCLSKESFLRKVYSLLQDGKLRHEPSHRVANNNKRKAYFQEEKENLFLSLLSLSEVSCPLFPHSELPASSHFNQKT